MKKNRREQDQRGIALLVAMIVLLFIAIIGIGFMFMSDTENSVNNNYRDSQKAYFASRAGLEDVRVLLSGGNLNTQANGLDGKMPSGTGGVIYVFNPTGSETISPTSGDYVDDELCQEQFSALNKSLGYTTVTPGVPCAAPNTSAYYKQATGLNVSSSNPAGSDIPYTGTASALPFKWVRITNKQNLMGLMAPSGPAAGSTVDNSTNYSLQVCYNGTNEFTIPSGQTCIGQVPSARPVWLLTSEAVTPRIGNRPGSKRVTQMEVALSPPLLPPGVVSTQAPLLFHGSSVNVDGMDNCSCNPAKCTTNSTTGVTTCASRSNSSVNCSSPYVAAYTAGTVSTSGGPTSETIYGNNLTGNASTQNVSPWPYNVGSLINSYMTNAVQPSWAASSCTGTSNFTATPPLYVQCGTQTGGTYGTFPGMDSTGALNNSPAPVDQTTYVPGSVHLAGGPTGAGVLIIDGDATIDSGFQFYGLLLVRGQVTFSGGGSAGTNIYGAILAGGDVSNAKVCLNPDDNLCTDSIGGNVNLQYDVCALSNAPGSSSPRLLATHEIQY